MRIEVLRPLRLEIAVPDAKERVGHAHVQGGEVVDPPVVDRLLSLGEQCVLPETEMRRDTGEEHEHAHGEEEPRNASHVSLRNRQEGQARRETEPCGALIGRIDGRDRHGYHQNRPVTFRAFDMGRVQDIEEKGHHERRAQHF